MTTPRPSFGDEVPEAKRQRSDALTDGGLVRVFDAMHSKTHKPDCDCGLRNLFIEGIEERERAARASLADEVREAERKRSDAEREVAALRAIVARYKVPLPLLRAAIENVRPYAGFHDDVRVITAADAFADILAALAKEEGS